MVTGINANLNLPQNSNRHLEHNAKTDERIRQMRAHRKFRSALIAFHYRFKACSHRIISGNDHSPATTAYFP